MIRVRLTSKTCFIFIMMLVAIPVVLQNDVTDSFLKYSIDQHTVSQSDTTPPIIWDWDISGHANQKIPFVVWANVTDEGVGIRNVTVRVVAPNYTLVEELSYNGTFYQKQLDPLIFPGEYNLIVRAYDMNNNTRTGRHILITITSPEDQTIDESITMPIVAGSSGALAAIVIIFALMYDRRQEEMAETLSAEALG